MLFNTKKDRTTGTGRLGEGMALRHLQERGYEILATNYRKRFGEVDIVARWRGTIVFVEVKTRHSRRYGVPQEAVDERKQRRSAACHATQENPHGTASRQEPP